MNERPRTFLPRYGGYDEAEGFQLHVFEDLSHALETAAARASERE